MFGGKLTDVSEICSRDSSAAGRSAPDGCISTQSEKDQRRGVSATDSSYWSAISSSLDGRVALSFRVRFPSNSSDSDRLRLAQNATRTNLHTIMLLPVIGAIDIKLYDVPELDRVS